MADEGLRGLDCGDEGGDLLQEDLAGGLFARHEFKDGDAPVCQNHEVCDYALKVPLVGHEILNRENLGSALPCLLGIHTPPLHDLNSQQLPMAAGLPFKCQQLLIDRPQPALLKHLLHLP